MKLVQNYHQDLYLMKAKFICLSIQDYNQKIHTLLLKFIILYILDES